MWCSALPFIFSSHWMSSMVGNISPMVSQLQAHHTIFQKNERIFEAYTNKHINREHYLNRSTIRESFSQFNNGKIRIESNGGQQKFWILQVEVTSQYLYDLRWFGTTILNVSPIAMSNLFVRPLPLTSEICFVVIENKTQPFYSLKCNLIRWIVNI